MTTASKIRQFAARLFQSRHHFYLFGRRYGRPVITMANFGAIGAAIILSFFLGPWSPWVTAVGLSAFVPTALIMAYFYPRSNALTWEEMDDLEKAVAIYLGYGRKLDKWQLAAYRKSLITSINQHD